MKVDQAVGSPETRVAASLADAQAGRVTRHASVQALMEHLEGEQKTVGRVPPDGDMRPEAVTRHETVGYAALTHPTVLPLADVAEIVSGYGFPKDMQGKAVGELPFFKVGDISAAWNSGQKKLTQAQHYLSSVEAIAIKAKPFPKGTVVFAKIGEAIKLNRRVILGQRSIVDNNVMGLIPKEGVVDQNYLFYWSLKLRLGDISQATTVPSVRKSDVEQLSFPWVPLDQQKRIVAEIEKQFSRLDEAVANLKRVKANLKRYKAAVLKAAVEGRLVETEAERARREGRSYETGAQLLQRILETRRSQWKGKGKYKEPADPDTTDLPKLPEGWVWASLEQLCPTFVDSAHRTPKYGEAGRPAIGPRDVVGGDLRLDGARLVDDNEFAIQTKRHIPQSGDIVYSRELSLGWGAVVPEDATLCLSQGMCLFRPDDQVVLSYFMYSLNGPEVRKQSTRGSTGSAHPHLNLGDIKAFTFSLPPQSEQHRIVSEVDRHLSLLRETEAQVGANLQRAERLRQSVLQRAFSISSVGTAPRVTQ